MASSKEYLDFILEQLSELEEMWSTDGEYIIYYRGKIVMDLSTIGFLVGSSH